MMPTILIADDAEDIRILVKTTLGSDNFTILEASSGDEALAIVRERHPKVVLLDVSMPPGIDGFEVCRRIRADDPSHATRVIMLTAAGSVEDRKSARDAGADDYFVKPFSPLALLNRVYEELDR